MPPRELRSLVPFEVAAVVVAACVSVPVPVVVPLLVVASVSLWLRGHGLGERVRGPVLYALIGAGAGIVGLALSIGLGTPLVEAFGDHAVQWSMYPVVRGSWSTFVMVAIVVGVGAIAAELVMRAWIVERALELSRGNVVLAVAIGGLVEALIADGGLGARAGAAVFGIGLGAMYMAGGRSVVAPLCARLAFSLGALLLEAMRVIG